jgi:hypothetical protein
LIEVPRFAPPPFLASNFFVVGVLIIAALILVFYNGDYRRMKHEQLLETEIEVELGMIVDEREQLGELTLEQQ